MKLPRGVSGERLVRALEGLGYSVIRQKGNHARLRHDGPPVHSITVPLHDPLKIGTLQHPFRSCADEVDDRRGHLRVAVKTVWTESLKPG